MSFPIKQDIQMKLMVAGVGGQGVVYLTNILVEAAIKNGIDVHVSEIHGLSQRGGVVTSGIGLGKNYTGFSSNAKVDFLFGMEPLETQRVGNLLHQNSSVIFGNNPLIPYSVNSGQSQYPDGLAFYHFLKENCREVIYVDGFPPQLQAVVHNLFLLGKATTMHSFPFSFEVLEDAIKERVFKHHLKNSLLAFYTGANKSLLE